MNDNNQKSSAGEAASTLRILTQQEWISECWASQNMANIGGKSMSNDNVNHPKHYTQHPSGIECITITEHMGFNLGNAVKYIWRADLKNDSIEDLRKAVWYVQREIEKRIKE